MVVNHISVEDELVACRVGVLGEDNVELGRLLDVRVVLGESKVVGLGVEL